MGAQKGQHAGQGRRRVATLRSTRKPRTSEHNENAGDYGDHPRILLFVLATRLPVFLMGALPEEAT